MPRPQTDAEIPGFGKDDLQKVRDANKGFMDEDEEEEGETPPAPPKPAPSKPSPAEEKPPAPAKPPKPAGEEPPVRPQRYIPIPQYQEEKAAWKQREKELVAELETLKTSTKPDTAKEDDAIKAMAEEHGVTEKLIRDLLGLARSNVQLPEHVLKQLDKTAAANAEAEDLSYFEKEFETDVLPIIKERYPDASPEVIAQVKAELDKIAHSTERLARTPLDYVFSRHEADFAEIFKPAPGKKGAETSRLGPGRTKGVTAETFMPDKDGKYDFSPLDGLDEEQKNDIISALSPLAYAAYIEHLAKKEHEGGLDVSRAGRRIRLK